MKKRSRVFAMFAALFGTVIVGFGATTSAAAPRSGAVALSTTLCCGSSSPEVKAAAAAGLSTTIVDPVTGNVIVIGTDPTFHHFAGQNSAGATDLINNGIAWAASKEPTGAYITLSCYYHGAPKRTPVT